MTADFQNGGLKNMNEVGHGLKLKLALDKTLIGRIQKGFDFLGYRFDATGLCGLAQKTINNQCSKRLRLDEPNPPDQRAQTTIASWLGWARTGISPAAVGGL